MSLLRGLLDAHKQREPPRTVISLDDSDLHDKGVSVAPKPVQNPSKAAHSVLDDIFCSSNDDDFVQPVPRSRNGNVTRQSSSSGPVAVDLSNGKGDSPVGVSSLSSLGLNAPSSQPLAPLKPSSSSSSRLASATEKVLRVLALIVVA